MNIKVNQKLMYRLGAIASVLLAICIICGNYLLKYNVDDNLPALEQAASRFTGYNLSIMKTMEVPENTRKEDHGIYGVADSPIAGGFLVAICESEIEGQHQWTGPVLFEKGLNGKYRTVESQLTNLPWPVETVNMNDSSFSMFGGGDDGSRAVLVLWSDVYPEEMAGYQIPYYDVESYLVDGTIVPLTLDVPVEPGSSLHMTCVNIPFNYYDHDHSEYFAYDSEGKEIDLRAFREANGELNGEGKGQSGDSAPAPDMYGCILLAGIALAMWLWKKSKKITE